MFVCMYVCIYIIYIYIIVCVCVCYVCMYSSPTPHPPTHTHTPCVERLLEDAGRNEDTVDFAVVVTVHIRRR